MDELELLGETAEGADDALMTAEEEEALLKDDMDDGAGTSTSSSEAAKSAEAVEMAAEESADEEIADDVRGEEDELMQEDTSGSNDVPERMECSQSPSASKPSSTSEKAVNYRIIEWNEYSANARRFLSNSQSSSSTDPEVLKILREKPRCRSLIVEKNTSGLVSTTNIDEGSYIVELCGFVSLQEDVLNREGAYVNDQTFLFEKDGHKIIIDARQCGNGARVVRRSCKPNAELQEIMHGTYLHIMIKAKEYVNKNTEIKIGLEPEWRKNVRPVQECTCKGEELSSCEVDMFFNPKGKGVQSPSEAVPSSTSGSRLTKSVTTLVASGVTVSAFRSMIQVERMDRNARDLQRYYRLERRVERVLGVADKQNQNSRLLAQLKTELMRVNEGQRTLAEHFNKQQNARASGMQRVVASSSFAPRPQPTVQQIRQMQHANTNGIRRGSQVALSNGRTPPTQQQQQQQQTSMTIERRNTTTTVRRQPIGASPVGSQQQPMQQLQPRRPMPMRAIAQASTSANYPIELSPSPPPTSSVNKNNNRQSFAQRSQRNNGHIRSPAEGSMAAARAAAAAGPSTSTPQPQQNRKRSLQQSVPSTSAAAATPPFPAKQPWAGALPVATPPMIFPNLPAPLPPYGTIAAAAGCGQQQSPATSTPQQQLDRLLELEQRYHQEQQMRPPIEVAGREIYNSFSVPDSAGDPVRKLAVDHPPFTQAAPRVRPHQQIPIKAQYLKKDLLAPQIKLNTMYTDFLVSAKLNGNLSFQPPSDWAGDVARVCIFYWIGTENKGKWTQSPFVTLELRAENGGAAARTCTCRVMISLGKGYLSSSGQKKVNDMIKLEQVGVVAVAVAQDGTMIRGDEATFDYGATELANWQLRIVNLRTKLGILPPMSAQLGGGGGVAAAAAAAPMRPSPLQPRMQRQQAARRSAAGADDDCDVLHIA